MAVINLEEVEPFLPVTLTPPQKAMVEDLIDLVEGELKETLNCPIEITKFVEERYVINLTEPTLYLINTPVRSVEAVISDGNPVDASQYTVRTWGLDFGGFNTLALTDPVIWTPSNAHFTWWETPDVLTLASGEYPQGIWLVSYTAGLDGRHLQMIRSILIKAIRREIASVFRGFNGDFTSIKVEDYSMSRSDKLINGMVGSFTEGEIKMLSNLTHKSIS